jgi:hypothetical protein
MVITSSYLGTTKGGYRCLFFLLFEDYIEAQSGLSEELKLEIKRFARNMGGDGAVIAPFAGDVAATQIDVRERRWRHGDVDLLLNTPAMLMIDKDFAEFDPRYDRWVLFHFGRHSDQDAGKFRSLLQKTADAVNTENANPFEVVQRALTADAVRAASKSIEFTLGVWGVTVDLRTAWKAFKDYLRAQKSRGGTE